MILFSICSALQLKQEARNTYWFDNKYCVHFLGDYTIVFHSG